MSVSFRPAIEYSDGTVVALDDLVDAWLPFIDAIGTTLPGPTHQPWYVGETVDHLFPTCPGLRRKELRVGRGAIHPEAGDICGWCLRVWKARR